MLPLPLTSSRLAAMAKLATLPDQFGPTGPIDRLKESRIEVEGNPTGAGVADGEAVAPGVEVGEVVTVAVADGPAVGGVVGVGVWSGWPNASETTHAGGDPFGGTLWFPSCSDPSQDCGPSSLRTVPAPFDIE